MPPWENYQPQQNTPAVAGPWAKYSQSENNPPSESPDSPMIGALKDIGGNTLEALKNTATQTGEAMSEPMNNPDVSDWGQHPIMGPIDATVRGVGKLGNAIGGTFGAVTSPLTGALSASVENSGVIPAAASAIKNNLVPNDSRFTGDISPEAQHQIAMQGGGDLSNAVMMGMAGNQGAANAAKAAGLPSAPKPYDPMQGVWDQLQKQSQNTAPRQGLFESQSSDPNIAPVYKGSPKEVLDIAKFTYENAEKMGGAIPAKTIQQTIGQLAANKDIGQQTARGQAFTGDNIVTKTMADLQDAAKDNSPWTIKDANEIDDALRGRIQQARASGDYDAARRLGIIKTGLRDTYKAAAASDPQGAAGFNEWIKGDKLYSAGMAAQDAQEIINNGERADVPSTAIKNGFKTFVKNDDNRAGLSDEEWAAAEHAAKTGIVTAALKTMGSKIISGVAGGMGGAAGGGFPGAMIGAAAGEAAGFPMRAGATALQKGRANDFIQTIMQRPAVQEALATKNTPSSSQTSSPLFTPKALTYSPIPLLPLAEENPQQTAAQQAQKLLPAPAIGGIGQQNMQELQKVKAALPPQSNAAPDVKSFAKAESTNNPNAKNPNSTASGLYQFTNRTWNDMVAKYGKQTGIGFGDKDNPQAQATMAQLYAKDNIASLQKTIGRMPTKGELYMAHVLGAQGAAKLIKGDPKQEAIMLYPRQVFDANRPIFFDGKRPRNVGEVRNILIQKVAA